jgi:hypothetical protein
MLGGVAYVSNLCHCDFGVSMSTPTRSIPAVNLSLCSLPVSSKKVTSAQWYSNSRAVLHLPQRNVISWKARYQCDPVWQSTPSLDVSPQGGMRIICVSTSPI